MKPLLIYVHSPLHSDTPRFCADILGSKVVTEFVDANMLCWVGSVSTSDGLEAWVWCKVW